MKKTVRLSAYAVTAAILLTACVGCADKKETAEQETTALGEVTESYVWQTMETEPNDCDGISVAFTVPYLPPDYLTQEETDLYRALCEGVAERKTAIPCRVEPTAVLMCFSMTPLSALTRETFWNGDELCLTYAADSAEQKAIWQELTASAAKMIASAEQEESEAEKTLHIYTAVTAAVASDVSEDSPWEVTLSDGRRIERSQSLFLWALNQNGVSAIPVTDGNRIWTAACIDGAWYHFLPNYEVTDTGGHGLFYFAVNDTELSGMGVSATTWEPFLPKPTVKQEEETPVTEPDAETSSETTAVETDGATEEIREETAFVLICNSARFSALRNVLSWSWENDSIVFPGENGERTAISLK